MHNFIVNFSFSTATPTMNKLLSSALNLSLWNELKACGEAGGEQQPEPPFKLLGAQLSEKRSFAEFLSLPSHLKEVER